jgi:hypothetical protein
MKGIKLFDGMLGYRDIPKTACTSLKSAFFKSENMSDYSPNATNTEHIHQFYGIDRHDISSCMYRLIIIRDPIKRLLSAYSNRVIHHKELSKNHIKKNHPELLTVIPGTTPTLSDFIKDLALYRQVGAIAWHTQKLTDFDFNSLSDFTDIIPIENLDSNIHQLAKKVGFKIDLGREQTGGRAIKLCELSKNELNYLINYFKEDYELLEPYYTAEKIEKEWDVQSKQEAKIATKKNEAPFIIWTFRRTGGTNIAQSLFLSSRYNAVEHEPFNLDRVWGEITAKWKRNKDSEQLNSSISKVLQSTPLIKHCVEIMPHELNTSLMKLSSDLGYKHIFLYREFPTDRLLSLNFSMKTNVWGSKHLKTRPFSEDVYNLSIDTQALITHEKNCRSELRRLYNIAQERTNGLICMSFESLYKSNYQYSKTLVQSVFRQLSLPEDLLTEEFFQRNLQRGKQGTSSLYKRFKGSNEFILQANKISKFELDKIGTLKVLSILDDDIKYTEIWEPLRLADGTVMIEGVLLLNNPIIQQLQIITDDIEVTQLHIGFESPRILKKFPKIKSSNKCRFLSSPIDIKNINSLLIEGVLADGNKSPLVKITKTS